MLCEIYWNSPGIARNLDFIEVGHGTNVDHIWFIGEDVGRHTMDVLPILGNHYISVFFGFDIHFLSCADGVVGRAFC
jgi:hypothetical protein